MNPVLYFLGVDTAPSENQRSDDGAVVVGAATPRRILSPGEPLPKFESDWYLDYIYARIFNAKHKLDARQWAGFIYALDRRFGGFTQITVDGGAGGGGIFVKRAMMSTQQLIDGSLQTVVPICDKTLETQQSVGHARFILNIFKRGDPGVDEVWPDPNGGTKSLAGDELLKDAVHCAYREALRLGIFRWPPDADEYEKTHAEELRHWDRERIWALKNLTVGWKQLTNIVVETFEKDGLQIELTTSRGARKFHTVGRDDVAMGHIYTYVSFRIYLQGEEVEQPAEEDMAGFEGR